ncbi:BRCT domain-containing protein [Artemisia annua]|uniref:BRCT domain-containing protein n=1 Tax=Artemisia annua TaxID=35608 RepID=A0A2U1PW38_ARTAN|nr:BRCT domain-containing protein [Artemisia annua]
MSVVIAGLGETDTWVLDSVAAKKLLNWVPYQLDQIAASEANNQPKLSTFLSLRTR